MTLLPGVVTCWDLTRLGLAAEGGEDDLRLVVPLGLLDQLLDAGQGVREAPLERVTLCRGTREETARMPGRRRRHLDLNVVAVVPPANRSRRVML